MRRNMFTPLTILIRNPATAKTHNARKNTAIVID